MDIRKLLRAIVDGLEDVKANDIVVFNTEHLSPLFERVIIASGTSNRQTKALAASVRDAVRSNGMQVLRTEGEANGEWIIVDCGAAVAHIMQPSIREYYHLEELWGDKPVKMKLDGQTRVLVKAEVPQAAEAPARGAGKSRPAPRAKPKPAKLPAPTPGSARAAALKRAKPPAAKPKAAVTQLAATAAKKTTTRKKPTAPDTSLVITKVVKPRSRVTSISGTAPRAGRAVAAKVPVKTAPKPPMKASARPAEPTTQRALRRSMPEMPKPARKVAAKAAAPRKTTRPR